ncbi:hypothetical protein OA856_01000 [Pelagibacteraceae bacterium]|nr:hypothetical protein [Pelagibacteraceae bacterium]
MIIQRKTFVGVILTLLIISVFLPNLNNSLIRFDQLTIYVIFIILASISLLKFQIPKQSISLILFIFFLLLISIFGIAFSNDYKFLQNRELYDVLSNFEKFTRIIALVFIVNYLINSLNLENTYKLKNFLINFFLLLLCIHTLFMLYVLFQKNIPEIILNNYWMISEDNLIDSVAGRSYLNSRITGIFQQPMEVGCVYMLGVLLFLYKCEFNYIFILKKFYILILLLLGGILSVSKTFYLGITITSLIFIFNYRNLFLNFIIIFFLFYLFFSFVNVNYLSLDWSGMKNYLIIFEMIKSFEINKVLTALSGGRFGSTESAQTLMFNQILNNSFFVGFGLGSFAANEVPVDSGYMHIFYLCGFIGLISMVFVLLYTFVIFFKMYLYNKTNENLFMLLFLIYIIFVNTGAPIFILNRTSTVIWVFLTLFALYISKKKSLILK